MVDFCYLEPRNIQEVFDCRKGFMDKAVILAGGTDVVVNIRSGKLKPEMVVSLRKVKELNNRIETNEKGLLIGALTTLSDIYSNTDVKNYFPALAQASNLVGSKQIRNRATLVGNICNASPAADSAPALLIYNAGVNIISENGKKQIMLEDFIIGPGKTALQKGELVESIFLPFQKKEYGSVYLRLSRREGVDLSGLGVGVLAAEDGEARIAFGAVGPKPFRAREAEALISEKGFRNISVETILNAVVKEANPISDLRASKEYRLEMVREYTKMALESAINSLEKVR